jgi:integrase
MLSQNPSQFVELPRKTRQEMRALNGEEAVSFLKAAADDPHCLIFAFALTTGMRPEEYLAVQWKDVDLGKGTVTVQRTVCWRRQKGGGWYFGEPKTQQSRRTIPLPVSISQQLVEHHRRQAEQRMKLGPNYANFDLVFATSDGGPLQSDNLAARNFKAILKKAGLPSTIRLYDLRHSCATLLLQVGENPKVVSERLGHSSVVLTLDVYSHVLPTMRYETTAKLESMLFSKSGTQ